MFIQEWSHLFVAVYYDIQYFADHCANQPEKYLAIEMNRFVNYYKVARRNGLKKVDCFVGFFHMLLHAYRYPLFEIGTKTGL